jgi:hypothetical protein
VRHALLIHYPEPAAGSLSKEEIEAGMAAFDAYAKALDEAGVLRSAEVLEPAASARSVSVRKGARHVRDGPFAETKEMFAGIFVIDVPDLDAALAWAARCPAAEWGTVEVRPSGVRFVDGAWRRAG